MVILSFFYISASSSRILKLFGPADALLSHGQCFQFSSPNLQWLASFYSRKLSPIFGWPSSYIAEGFTGSPKLCRPRYPSRYPVASVTFHALRWTLFSDSVVPRLPDSLYGLFHALRWTLFSDSVIPRLPDSLYGLESMPAMRIMIVLFLAHICFLTSYSPIILRLFFSLELIGTMYQVVPFSLFFLHRFCCTIVIPALPAHCRLANITFYCWLHPRRHHLATARRCHTLLLWLCSFLAFVHIRCIVAAAAASIVAYLPAVWHFTCFNVCTTTFRIPYKLQPMYYSVSFFVLRTAYDVHVLPSPPLLLQLLSLVMVFRKSVSRRRQIITAFLAASLSPIFPTIIQLTSVQP